MTGESIKQLALLATEGVVACGLLLLFFRLRQQFGLSLLYVTLGTFQHLQTQLATTVFVEIVPGIIVSPGSAVIFTATLFAVLLVYIREDALQARSLIMGIVAANLALSLLTLIVSFHNESPLAIGTAEFDLGFVLDNLRSFIVGTGLLLIDVILIIMSYEFFYRIFARQLFLRIFSAMTLVVLFDSLLFTTAAFYGEETFRTILLSGILAKIGAAALYAAMLAAYLKIYPVPRSQSDESGGSLQDIFQILTYRQRYDLLKDELTRDHLTGLFNRRQFDDNIGKELLRAQRLGHEVNVVIYDLDHFKSINDRYGHATGDEVLVAFADAMRQTFREADIACRFGGEEFVVVMPDSSAAASVSVSRRLQAAFAKACADRNAEIPRTSFTAGVATFPQDGSTAAELLRVADARLYEGKKTGRARIIVADNMASLVAAS